MLIPRPTTLQKLNGPIAAAELYHALTDMAARIEALEAHAKSPIPMPLLTRPLAAKVANRTK